ncbi:MAG TPA: penicillin acylase family protein [Bryobacteraceae bacterium]|nr:penicillin acylase family protein [Bryobacteraceae bacterium]
MDATGRILVLLLAVSTAPAYSRPDTTAANNLKDQVTIYRDRYGVPHILGETEQATFFGYGYAQAQDHLVGMMLQYRDVQGRLSEVLGNRALGRSALTYHAGDYRWDGDYLQRLLRTWQTVEERRKEIDPFIYSILDAFSQGVNFYIAEHRREIPDWIDRVTPEDIEALERGNYMRYYSVNDALMKLAGVPEEAPQLGSNHWAVAASRAASGHNMLVGEVHMPWNNRFQLYEAQLITPGKLNAGGISWFGSPFFLCGFNSGLSWSVSYNKPNIADVYQEALNPGNSLQYLYDGKWREVRKTSATFRVRKTDGSFGSTTLPLYYTQHGPIVSFDPVHHRAFSIKLPNFEGVNYSKGLYDLMKAGNVAAFRAALAEQLIPRWNYICIDKKHIYYVHNAIVARRDPGYNWLKPVPGWTSRTEWKGYLPFSANPQILDPPSGFLQNANTAPWVSTRDSGINPQQPTSYYYSYPVDSHSGEESLNERGERLFGVLTRAGERFSIGQMKSLAFDTYILAADLVLPLLQKACSRHPDDREAAKAANTLLAWNRRAEKDSVGFTYFFYWAKAYQELYGAAFGRFNAYNRDGMHADSIVEQERAWSALHLGVSELKQRFGRTEVPWGEINRVIRGGSFALHGTGIFDTLHPDFGPERADGHIDCDDGWGHMMVAVESTPKQVWTLLPYGESQDPQSAHYNDMARLHSERELKPFWLTAKDILQNTESVWGDRTRILHANF